MSDEFEKQKAQQEFRKFISAHLRWDVERRYLEVPRSDVQAQFLRLRPEFSEFADHFSKVREAKLFFVFDKELWDSTMESPEHEKAAKYRPSNDYELAGFLWALLDLMKEVCVCGGVVMLPPRRHDSQANVAVIEVVRLRAHTKVSVTVGLHEEFENRADFKERVASRLNGAQIALLDPEEENEDDETAN